MSNKFFKQLKKGLEEAVAYKKGKIQLTSELIEIYEDSKTKNLNYYINLPWTYTITVDQDKERREFILSLLMNCLEYKVTVIHSKRLIKT